MEDGWILLGGRDEWAADVRRRKTARRAEWTRTGEQQKTEALRKLGQRDDLPVEALDHVVYLVDAFNEYGVPDLDKVPEAYRDRLESTLKRRGWHYLGGNTQGSSG